MANTDNEKKKEILLQSFEVLSEDLANNDEGIKEILQKMIVSLNEWKIGFEMWTHVLQNNSETKTADIFDLLYRQPDDVRYNVGKFISDKQIINYVINSLKNIDPGISRWGGYHKVISSLLSHKNYDEACLMTSSLLEIYNLEEQTTFLSECIRELKDTYSNDINESVINIIYSFIEKVDDKMERAKLNTKMVDIL